MFKKLIFPTGKIAEEITFKNGQRDGIYKVYVENGNVVEESNFKNNLYDGPAIYRDVNGKLASKGNYVKDEKKGMWEFYEDGKLVKKEQYPLRIKFNKRTNIPKQ